MMARAALISLVLLAGCAAPVATIAPDRGVAVAGATVAAAAAMPERASLRRIGYRNCNGFAMELFAPARLTAASVAGESLYLRAYSYRGGGAIQTLLPGSAMRVQQQTGSGWRDLPVTAAGVGSVGGSTASAPVAGQMGQVGRVMAGRYRLWLGQFTASRGGAVCSMSPVWQFDIG